MIALSTATEATASCVATQAPTVITRGGPVSLINASRLSCGGVYPMSLASLSAVSAQAFYSSATLTAGTFGDGTSSAGSVTLSDYTKLTATKATNQITVASTSGLTGATITWPGHTITNGIDWASSNSASLTATSIAAALTRGGIPSHAAGSVVYSTAPAAGTYYNNYGFATNAPSSLTLANASLTGGRNNAILYINGVALAQGSAWTAATSSAATATSLASAINGNSFLTNIHATANSPSAGHVALASKFTGTAMNYKLQQTASSGWSLSGAAMTGGTNSAYALSGNSINMPNNDFSLGMALLYTKGSSPVIGGLSSGTTYYAAPSVTNPALISLASSQANAVAGTYITFTSSSTQSSADTYTLTPLGITGTPGFKWQVSNDGVNWIDLQVSSVTMSSYTTPPTTTAWDFGTIGLGYLGISATSPTTGAIYLNIQVNGR